MGSVQISPLHGRSRRSEKLSAPHRSWERGTRATGIWEGCLRVAGYQVAVCHVNALYYVDFSSLGPVRAIHPDCNSGMM